MDFEKMPTSSPEKPKSELGMEIRQDIVQRLQRREIKSLERNLSAEEKEELIDLRVWEKENEPSIMSAIDKDPMAKQIYDAWKERYDKMTPEEKKAFREESRIKTERTRELEDKEHLNDILNPITKEQYAETLSSPMKEGFLKNLTPEEQQEYVDLSQRERLVKMASMFFKTPAARERFLAEVEQKGPKTFEEIKKIRQRHYELAQKIYAPEK
jgi:hypothetical protein